MASNESQPGGEQEDVVEQLHQEAKTQIKWQERPTWLNDEVSELSYFIADEKLRADILAAGPDAFNKGVEDEVVTEQDLEEYKLEAMKAAEQYVLQPDQIRENINAYHNYEHTRQVIERTVALILNSEPRVTAQEARAMVVAAAFHDCDHPGIDNYVHEDGTSNEQNSVNTMLQYARDNNFTLRQQVEMYNVIIGTSFWDKDSISPLTRMERLFRLADLAGFMEKEYNGTILVDADMSDWSSRMQALAEWMEQSVAVADEHARKDVPPDFIRDWLDEEDSDLAVKKWLNGQFFFIKFGIEGLLKKMHEDGDLVDISEYETNLDEKRRLVFKIKGEEQDLFRQDASIDLADGEAEQLDIIMQKIVLPKLQQLREELGNPQRLVLEA